MEVDREGLRRVGSEGGEGKRSSGRGEGSLMGGGEWSNGWLVMGKDSVGVNGI